MIENTSIVQHWFRECLATGQMASHCLDQSLRWRHNGHDGVSNHQHHHCLLNHLFGCRSKKTSKLRVTGLCVGNSPGTGEFPAQRTSDAENASIWWRHHEWWPTTVTNIYDVMPHWCNSCSCSVEPCSLLTKILPQGASQTPDTGIKYAFSRVIQVFLKHQIYGEHISCHNSYGTHTGPVL